MSESGSEIAAGDVVVHERTFSATANELFAVIDDSTAHGEMTGAPASLATEPGSRFTTHGGAIEGWLLGREEGTFIAQAWRPADWPPGVYSMVRYDFADVDGGGSQLTLTHSAIPEGAATHLADGWNSMYWTPLEAYLSAAP